MLKKKEQVDFCMVLSTFWKLFGGGGRLKSLTHCAFPDTTKQD